MSLGGAPAPDRPPTDEDQADAPADDAADLQWAEPDPGDQLPAQPAPPAPLGDPDCVITTVVSRPARDPLASLPPMDLGDYERSEAIGDAPPPAPAPAPPSAPAAAAVPEPAPEPAAQVPEPAVDPEPAPAAAPHAAPPAAPEPVEALGPEDRLARLEQLPVSVEALSRATRQELERCAGVLFGHDRALNDAGERLGVLTARLEALERRAPDPAAPSSLVTNGAPIDNETLLRVLGQLDDFGRRLVAMETRVEPLEAVPTIVQALRRAVRSSDDQLAAEAAARQAQAEALASDVAAQADAREETLRRLMAQDLARLADMTAGQAQAVGEVAARVASAEARLAPLDTAPADIEALSRVVRRELDAVAADNQARDQMLRRALQNEIDRLHAASAVREQAAAEMSQRLLGIDDRLGELTEAVATGSGSSAARLDALEGRMATTDGVGAQLEALSTAVRTELEQLRVDARTHDQVMGEITRRFSALDGRLARFDPLPGEIQSLRTALRQDSERAVGQLRALDERLGQLAWVPGEFQEARKRILALTSGVQLGQDSIRSLEASLATTNDRLKALGARLSPPGPPGPPA